MMIEGTRSATVLGRKDRSEVATAAIVALLAGLGMLWLTGFAQPELLHAAAHDWRHSMSFPCH